MDLPTDGSPVEAATIPDAASVARQRGRRDRREQGLNGVLLAAMHCRQVGRRLLPPDAEQRLTFGLEALLESVTRSINR